ncbi:hypothetical protein HDV02_005149 [Globomyces sp. JEL0801]|nr:hypothetical protein HDV02_005149 [Globomyces sp. JEL0801]
MNSKIPATVEHVQVTWTDLCNLTRARMVLKSRFDDIKTNGLSVTSAILSFPMMYDGMLPNESSAGEVRLVPSATVKALPWAPEVGITFGSFSDGDKPWNRCPRSFLANQAQKLQLESLKLTVGFELEFVVNNLDGTPLDQTSKGKGWKVLSKIVESLKQLDIPVWQYHSESAHGQFEISIGPFVDSPLLAADSLVLARQTIYSVADTLGCQATFLPKPYPMQAGSAAHTHVSLTHGNENVMSKPIGHSFLAGVHHHLPDVLPILNPTLNSYDRLQAHCWAGVYQCIGTENKEAPIRLIKGPKGGLERFEIKTADGTSNPYLMLGIYIAAGLDGVKSKFNLPSEINVDPATLPESERPLLFSTTLTAALEKFKKSEFVLNTFGSDLLELIAKGRQAEIDIFEQSTPEQIKEFLLKRY